MILILADALRADHLRCYGYRRAISQNIDNLAEEGYLFENAVAQSGWTKPSFAAIMTANHPTSVGVTGMNDGLIENITTASEVFKNHGFYTAAFITNPYLKEDQGYAQGFDEYHAIFTDNLSEYKIRADALNKRVFDWLEKNKDKKFFLVIFYLDPHTPYAPLPPYDTLFSPTSHVKENLWKEKISNPTSEYLNALTNLYDGEIAFLDMNLGKLFDRLKSLDLWDNSLIVFTADHGEEFYDHYWWQHNHSLYEELLHVPLIYRGPGLDEDIKVKSPVQHIELIPTILDLMNLPQSPTFTGRSFVPLMKEPDEIVNKLTYHETNLPEKKFIALRGTRWKLIYNLEKKSYMFFDLSKDPHEQNDILKNQILSPELKKNFLFFQKTLHDLAKEAYKLRHERRAFKKVKFDERSIKILEGLGYIMQ